MGALAEVSASDEAANYAGRAVLPEKETIQSKLVSCVLYSVGVCSVQFSSVQLSASVSVGVAIEATPLRIDRGALRY